ncbi:hypothetical protein J7337_013873 [Fusarium musae]|uniref:Uncharacterized protein n=1 Tax=Fusarium musae TaxID=1042133 RepID=A0A9P8IFK6_9HYPO|nr:hypothetical protein J7337_013873 [Fusarium musae]KAG9494734.1 hypothetical protein J7337_013873 [Fusarium musae]
MAARLWCDRVGATNLIRWFPKKRDQSDSESEDENDEQQEHDQNYVSEKEVKRRDLRWFYKTHPVFAPESSPQPELKFYAEDVKSTGIVHNILPEVWFNRLQVIIKLVDMDLTP